MFKNCSTGNNCFGVMGRRADWSYFLRTYETKKHSITDRIKMYERLNWQVRVNADQWLKWNYCASECAFWTGHYNTAVNRLWI